MNYEESRVYLDEISRYGSVLGLENMKELLDRLGNPQKDLKFIHISGTNGKGSCLAYLSTILSGAGYKTGRYISPTLDTYRERIQVDGEYINKDSLASHVTAIAKATEDMKKDNAGTPTLFEVETVLAFLYFKEKNCDIVVLETGLGGRLDATNIIDTSILEVIMPISLDHQGFLGDTIEEIAEQKAGIIKNNTKVISAIQPKEAAEVIEKNCKEKNCTLTIANPDEITIKSQSIKKQVFDYKMYNNIAISLPGSYQPQNAIVAIEAIEALRELGYSKSQSIKKQVFDYKMYNNIAISLPGSYQPQNAIVAIEAIEALRELGYSLSQEDILKGFEATVWKGRFTVLSEDNPVVIMDGAHNVAGAKELMKSLELYFNDKKYIYVFGVFSDKEYEEIINITAKRAEHIITVQTPNNPRALPAEDLKDAVKKVNNSCEASKNIEDAVKKAIKMTREDKERILVIFGSLSFLGEAEQAFYNEERRLCFG